MENKNIHSKDCGCAFHQHLLRQELEGDNFMVWATAILAIIFLVLISVAVFIYEVILKGVITNY